MSFLRHILPGERRSDSETFDSGLFAVVDTETTGLFPGGQHRIIEIAVLTMDASGGIVERWETLLNPRRDLGKQSLHGIRAEDVVTAPSFEDVADELSWRLSGKLLVGHNVSFDARFLAAEFARASVEVPESFFTESLCTMRLAHRYLPGAGRSLQDCCDACGITLGLAHSAGDDAQATAALLAQYLELDHTGPWPELLRSASARAWHSRRPASPIQPVLRSNDEDKPHFLERVVARIPEFSGSPEVDAYLGVLDRALIDRHLSIHEQGPRSGRAAAAR